MSKVMQINRKDFLPSEAELRPQTFGPAANQDVRVKLWGSNSKEVQKGLPYT